MLITNKEELKKYASDTRVWQGIPAIERTKEGRIFSAFYTGETREQLGNYVVLLVSDDDGRSFTEPVAVVYCGKQYRAYDQCLWIDPHGRLWLIYSVMPDHAVYAYICENPNAAELVFLPERKIGNDVMMNKPIALTQKHYLFPIAVWHRSMHSVQGIDSVDSDRKAFVYETTDSGESFTRLGGVDAPERSFDEHMLLPLDDSGKELLMLIRTHYGIAKSCSHDGGNTWEEATNSGFGGPDSRFFISRLSSGRVLFINHYDFSDRNNLYAMLSEDNGKSFPFRLLLDERMNVAYPDAKESENGFIYITYDRERGGFLKNLEDAYSQAREVLMCKITEEDILKGRLVNSESRLRVIINKLGKLNESIKNPYIE